MPKKNQNVLPLLLSGLSLLTVATSPLAKSQLPDYSAFANDKPVLNATPSTQTSSLVDSTHPLHLEQTLAVPSFLWAAPQATSTFKTKTANISAADIEKSARKHLHRYAALYRLNAAAQNSAKLHHIHRLADNGAIVKFSQQINGIEVFERRINVLLDDSLELKAISGYLSPDVEIAARTLSSAQAPFKLSIPQAIAAAFADLHSEDLPFQQLKLDKQRGVYQWYRLQSSPINTPHTLAKPVRAKKVFYTLSDHLEPAYYLELNTVGMKEKDKAAYSYVISAVDGSLLSRNNMIDSDAATPFSYSVWADDTDLKMPLDSPYGNELTPSPTPFIKPQPVSPSLVTLTCGPISTCDPWLLNTASQTVGNNINAYTDMLKPDGFNKGELRAKTTSPFAFNHSYDFGVFDNKDNPEQLQAALVQAFYTANFVHDWLYDHGFDEKAGNGQEQNYGRGGEEVDRMNVEINDYSGVNNANMWTPADGESPVMQLYLWDHDSKSVTIKLADNQTKRYAAIAAEFGLGVFNLGNKAVVAANDNVGVTSDACDKPLANASELAGNIAFIDRGSCLFVEKVKNAQEAGAVGVIIANNVSGALLTLGGSDPTISIPALGISQEAGKALKRAIKQAGQSGFTVSATMQKKLLPPYNVALDNSVVIHEWGHFLSQRLIAGLGNHQGRSLGEGWSDFLSLLAMVKEQDRLLSGNETFQGSYPVGIYANSNFADANFFGIRRYPYSTDMSKNPLTLKHISDGVALPTGVSAAATTDLTGADNSEVHNSGEVWASMLWEAYIQLLIDTDRYTFSDARDRMLDYLVASLKLTPAKPTFLEARDALLAVAQLRDAEDYQAFWKAFAKRGAGVHAVAPKRNSATHTGVAEDFSTP